MYGKSHRFRLLSNVFFTSNRWERVGGVPSLARAVFDRNIAFPTFHGPPQIQNYLHKFAELTDLNPELAIKKNQYNNNDFYDDAYMQVDFVELHRENASNSDNITVLAHVCRLQPRRGSIMLKKFTEMDIPVEHIRTINMGKNVTLADGTTIFAKDFLTQGFDGGNFLSKWFLASNQFNTENNFDLKLFVLVVMTLQIRN